MEEPPIQSVAEVVTMTNSRRHPYRDIYARDKKRGGEKRQKMQSQAHQMNMSLPEYSITSGTVTKDF